MIPQVVEQLKIKTKLVAYPIMMQLAQNIVRPLLGVELFCGRVQVFENFTHVT